jgi:hypothetical protein
MINPRELSPEEYDTECAISSETFQELAAKKELVAINCGHKFSKVHIARWLEIKTTCPQCLRHVDKGSFILVMLAVNGAGNNSFASQPKEQSHPTADFSFDIRKINGNFAPNEALEKALQVSSKIQKKDPKEPFEHHTMYEVVLTKLEWQSAKTFTSFDFRKNNRESTRLENAKLGDVFRVPGYFLNDWNKRFHPATRIPIYEFKLTHDDPELRRQLIEEGISTVKRRC